MLRYLVEDGEAKGIVLGLLEADGSTRVLSHGSAGAGARPLGPQTTFEIGSLTKTFTGTLLAEMVARGEVALSDPVARHLPAAVRVPSRGGRQITLRDLATHRSGLPRWPDNHGAATSSQHFGDYTVEQLYAFLSGHSLRRDPGTEFEYSNLGFGLLGHALARAGGRSYPELVRERILAPLRMQATGFPGARDEWMAKGHDEQGTVVPHLQLTEALAGAGAIRSTVQDMLVFLKANVTPAGTAVSRAMQATHEVQGVLPRGGIGLAWSVADERGRRLLMHNGATQGFQSQIGFDPRSRVGFVLLTNTRGFEDDLGADFLRRGLPLASKVVELPRATLERYAGEYEIATGRRAVVRLEPEGTLTLRVPGNVRFRMYADSDSSFFLKRTPWRVRFATDAAGRATSLTLNVNGTDRTARRAASGGTQRD
jgi:CubicO group peptidase (beta-lactamase class C family)